MNTISCDYSKMNETSHRRSIRLTEYDYSQEGAYFVAIVTQGRRYLFGEMKLNPAGMMVEQVCQEIPRYI